MTRRRVSMMPAASAAAGLLGAQIRLARHEKKWSAAELAMRAGVSARTVSSAEAGSANVSIGNFLNLAVLAGVPLFSMTDPVEIAIARSRAQEHIRLIPAYTRKPRPKDDDGDYDF